MALSGTFYGKTANEYIQPKIVWSATQSIDGNYSTVTATLYYSRTNTGYTTGGTWTGSITINGVTTSDSLRFNITHNSNTKAISATVKVPHNANGTKTITISAAGKMPDTTLKSTTISASVTLDTIPRASSLTASNGTLGTAMTLGITRASSTFKHKITYTCGNASGYAAGSSTAFTTATSLSWTPPVSLSNQNTTGGTVSITLYLKTYTSDGTQIGTVNKTITCNIPGTVTPSCTLTVTDPTGYTDIYGKAVSGLSKFKVQITATPAHGSPIVSYNTTVGSTKYTVAAFTTGVLNASGGVVINTVVKDGRGRSGSARVTKPMLAYTAPIVTSMTVHRCDEDGVENEQGEYVRVAFTASVTALNDLNTATYTVKYKKSSEPTFTEVTLDGLQNNYSVTDQEYIFQAESGSSYDVQLWVTDNHNTTKRATSVSTAFVLMHWKADGTGMSIGKLSEKSNLFDIGLSTRFNAPVYGNVLGLSYLPAINPNTDLNDRMITGSYAVKSNADAETIANIPVKMAGRLEVANSLGVATPASGWAYLRQKFIPYLTAYPTYERNITRNGDNVVVYGDWIPTTLCEQKILWSGARYMTADHTVELSELISQQSNGIELVFSRYANGVAEDANFVHHFVSKQSVIAHGGVGSAFLMATVNFTQVCAKYLYISNDRITGNELNNATGTNNGVTYNNAAYVLRYVIGV